MRDHLELQPRIVCKEMDEADSLDTPRTMPPLLGLKCESLDKEIVSELTARAIDSMTSDELERVIHVAPLPNNGQNGQLRHLLYDRDTLRRLAYLARKCCQRQCAYIAEGNS